MKTRVGVADLEGPDGETISNDKQKSELLNNFFSSVFTEEDTENMPEFNQKEMDNLLLDIDFNSDAVKEKLKCLNPNKASGPDGLYPRFLRELNSELSDPLYMIFRKSLDEGSLPQPWKDGHVSPIFKKGRRSLKSNYRPVSLTSVVCRVMESLIRDFIMKHMEDNELIADTQHGFVCGRSCITQLLSAIDKWTKILDEGGDIDCVYLDFAKAFDTVPHQRLLMKLEGYGIQGKVHKWVKAFLSERRQRVVINGCYSNWAPVTSGIPQGSVLGPLLFICFINDLPELVHNFIKIFADDTKIFAKVQNETDRDNLQHDLKSLEDWAMKWQMRFNADKCKTMHLGYHNKKYDYKMTSAEGEVTLEKTRVEKDLGVYVDDQLLFKEHIQKAASKGNKIVAMIRRSFDCLEPDTLVLLFKSLVRPHLEYGNTIWSPLQINQINIVENVQRRATKMLASIRDKPYQERLKILKLPSITYRRIRGDMIQTYKYIHDKYKVNEDLFTPTNYVATRGNSLKIQKFHCRLKLRENFFSVRSTNLWNGLPDEVVSAPSIDAFKNRLDFHWARHQYCLEPFNK